MAHFTQGAIDKTTGLFIDPTSAFKRTIYECPDCKKDVFAKKGEILIHHFCHKKDKSNPCTYYNRNPSLDQQHKNAQFKLKAFLEKNTKITIIRKCSCCECCEETHVLSYPIDGVIKINLEHRFKFNDRNRCADVALLNSDKICYIFEVVHTHYTREEHRPEPWFEINAKNINNIPLNSSEITLNCVRQKQTKSCIERKERERIEQEVFVIRHKRKLIILELKDYFKKKAINIERLNKQRELILREKEDFLRREKERRLRKEEQIEKNRKNLICELNRKIERDKSTKLKTILSKMPYCSKCSPLAKWLSTESGRCKKCIDVATIKL